MLLVSEFAPGLWIELTVSPVALNPESVSLVNILMGCFKTHAEVELRSLFPV